MSESDYAGGAAPAAPGPGPAGPPEAAVLPAHGQAAADVLAEVRRSQDRDVDYRRGRNWAFTYYAGEELLQVLAAAYQLGMSANGLSGAAFPSLARFESEILAWMGSLLGGGGGEAGSMTSGGSESILLAVKTARDLAQARGRPRAGQRGNVVAARSTHPGFAKAAHYLGLELRRAPLHHDQRADAAAMAAMIDDDTVLVVASAPSYPHGVVDDVPAIAQLAAGAGLPCHVDACVGGMVLPFARAIGAWHGEFGFEVPGVTSISADLHKYGYTAKGTSVVVYRTAELFGFQSFAHDEWTGGRYEVPNLCGTRPGGAITAAWAAMRYLGQDGYCELTRQSLAATAALRAGLAAIDGLHVAGDPDINLIAIGDARGRVREIARELRRRGWVLGTQGDVSRGEEKTMHLTVTAGHRPHIDEFLHDLAEAAASSSAG
ncbi:MAG TPA: aminotransferase class V-fold PLP-dependent enzyme [Streptosporangiaceae bacterium]|jgi:glutamate/tyrosine decarboxylase-like PLP-dependent enzyme